MIGRKRSQTKKLFHQQTLLYTFNKVEILLMVASSSSFKANLFIAAFKIFYFVLSILFSDITFSLEYIMKTYYKLFLTK